MPEIAGLHRRSFGASSNLPPGELRKTLLEVLFDGPWQREPYYSVVYENDDGLLTGFLGIFERKMEFDGASLRAGITSQLVADPEESGPQVPFLLMNRVFASDLDLVFTDGANGPARRIWLACGGEEVVSAGMEWRRLLRPAAYAASVLVKRSGLPSAVRSMARPLSSLIDRPLAHLDANEFRDRPDGLEREPLDPNEMLDRLPAFQSKRSLVPVYDPDSLNWILNQASRKRSQGELHRTAVRDPNGGLIGWYLYYLDAGKVGEVLQVAVKTSRRTDVLRSLYAEAWEKGAIALRGRVDPPLAHAFSRTHCLFFYDGPWTLAYSRHPRLRAAVHSGDAWLTGLECERWMRFLGG